MRTARDSVGSIPFQTTMSVCDYAHTDSHLSCLLHFLKKINTGNTEQNEMAERQTRYHCLWRAILKHTLFPTPAHPSKAETLLTTFP